MAEEEKKEEKKIIVNEDWKEEARKDKEILSKQEEEKKQETEEKQEAEEKEDRGPLPKGDLAALISMLTTQAFFALGALKIEGREDNELDLELAKYNIDMLETLEEKTRGNLTKEEETVLTNTLHQLHMVYVKVSG